MKKGIILYLCIVLQVAHSFGQQQPNIILIVADDLGWTDLQCYGSSFYETPNLDRLAAAGKKFTQSYAACNVCSPSRAALLTGKYPARLHITDWIQGHRRPYAKLLPPDWTMYLPLQEVTIAELLRAQGYATASIGKWHLGDEEKYYPENQGFDLNIGGYFKGSPNQYFSPYNNPRLPDGPPGEELTDRLTQEAIRYMEAHKNAPFFIYLPFYAVHTPLQAKQEDVAYFKKRINTGNRQQNPVYAAMIKNMDRNVGTLLEALEKQNLINNTLVIFTSDNGGLIGNQKDPRKQVTSNYPFREGKGTAYEGGVRIPTIFYWKGNIRPGGVDVPIISMDLYPTIAALAGMNGKNIPGNDGLDITPLLLDRGGLNERNLFWHYPHYHNQGATPYSSVRTADKKLVYYYETGKKELYDLKGDPEEQHDLSSRQPQEAARLYQLLQQWLQSVKAQPPRENPSYDKNREQEKGAYKDPE